MSGRLKWILDTHTEFVTEIICQTFQSSQFPSCIFFSSQSAVDNNSYPRLMTIRGQLLWLCVLTQRDEAITHHLSHLENVSDEDKRAKEGKEYC